MNSKESCSGEFNVQGSSINWHNEPLGGKQAISPSGPFSPGRQTPCWSTRTSSSKFQVPNCFSGETSLLVTRKCLSSTDSSSPQQSSYLSRKPSKTNTSPPSPKRSLDLSRSASTGMPRRIFPPRLVSLFRSTRHCNLWCQNFSSPGGVQIACQSSSASTQLIKTHSVGSTCLHQRTVEVREVISATHSKMLSRNGVIQTGSTSLELCLLSFSCVGCYRIR